MVLLSICASRSPPVLFRFLPLPPVASRSSPLASRRLPFPPVRLPLPPVPSRCLPLSIVVSCCLPLPPVASCRLPFVSSCLPLPPVAPVVSCCLPLSPVGSHCLLLVLCKLFGFVCRKDVMLVSVRMIAQSDCENATIIMAGRSLITRVSAHCRQCFPWPGPIQGQSEVRRPRPSQSCVMTKLRLPPTQTRSISWSIGLPAESPNK